MAGRTDILHANCATPRNEVCEHVSRTIFHRRPKSVVLFIEFLSGQRRLPIPQSLRLDSKSERHWSLRPASTKVLSSPQPASQSQPRALSLCRGSEEASTNSCPSLLVPAKFPITLQPARQTLPLFTTHDPTPSSVTTSLPFPSSSPPYPRPTRATHLLTSNPFPSQSPGVTGAQLQRPEIPQS